MCRLLFSVLIVLSMASCTAVRVPFDKMRVNATLYENPADLQARVDALEYDMPILEVYRIIGITPETTNIKWLKSSVIDIKLDHGIETTATLAEKEVYRERRRKENYMGIEVPYLSLDEEGYLDTPLNIVTQTTGYNLSLVLIFKDGKLYYWEYPIGIPNVATTKSTSLFGLAFKKVPSKAIDTALDVF